MSTADSMGAYLAGRFAGKMAASVEADGKLARQQRVAERAVREAEADIIALEGALTKAAMFYAFEIAKNAGFAAVRIKIDAESAKLAEHFAAGGGLASAAEFGQIAPFTHERRLGYADRVMTVQTARAAALEALEKFDFDEFGTPRGSKRDAEMRARILGWLEDFYR
jgi:hypothetical protein